jgi:hypothetical protein
MSKQVKLCDPLTYDVNNMVFTEPEERKLPNDTTVTYFRSGIKTKNEKGELQDLLLVLDRSTSFGVSTKFGASLGVMILDRDSPSPTQLKTLELFSKITLKCQDHLLEVKNLIKKPKLQRAHLDDISPIKTKEKPDGTPDDTKSPTMSLKLMPKKKEENKEQGFLTKFFAEDEFDELGNPSIVDPMDFCDKRSFVTCVIKVEGIFIGQVIKIQCKLYECEIKAADSNAGSLLQSFRKNQYKAPALKQKEDGLDDEDIDNFPDEDFNNNINEIISKPQIVVSDDEEEEKPKKEKARKSKK